MHPSVRDSFISFTDPLEGYVAHPYVDLIGLVTIAYGVLIDPVSLAFAIPLRRRDGSLATRATIAVDHARLRAQCCWTERPAIEKRTKPKECTWAGTGKVCLAHQGHRAAAKMTTLYLTHEDVIAVTLRKLDATEAELRRHFPRFNAWCPDAQLGTLSLAWAVGANLPLRYPRFSAACAREDWETAARECKIAQEHGTIGERNRQTVTCFRNALLIRSAHLDAERLYWPTSISDETPTMPELPVDELAITVEGGTVHPAVEMPVPRYDDE